MTLSNLGEEYLEQSRAVRGQIAALRPKLKDARGLELYRLRGRILRLYSIARELHDTGDYLINYYEKE